MSRRARGKGDAAREEVPAVRQDRAGAAECGRPARHPEGLWQHLHLAQDWHALRRRTTCSHVAGAFLNLTVREAALNTAVAVEVACWFYVGEIVGRGSLIGYAV